NTLRQAQAADARAVRARACRRTDVAWIADRCRRRAERDLRAARGRKQFTDVRRAHRALISAADQQAVDRLPAKVAFVAVDAARGRVVGAAERSADVQLVDQRHVGEQGYV